MINRNSIPVRVAAHLGISSLLLIVILAVLNTRFIQKQYQQVEEEILTARMEDALSTLGINLSYEFYDAVEETGKNILDREGILRVEIRPLSTERKFIFSKQPPNREKNPFFRSVPIKDPATKAMIGTLSVTYSRDRYHRLMREYYRYQAYVLVIYLVFIALLVYHLLRKFRPLTELADRMQSFDPKEGIHLLHYSGDGDEISRIAKAANIMLNNIREYGYRLERANRALKKSHDELEERVRQRTEELKEKQVQLAHAGRLSSLGELSAGLAHELGQPLQIINTAAEIVASELEQEHPDPEELLPIARKIFRQVDRAQAIIRNMRTFARYDQTRTPSLLDIRQPLEECLGFFREQFQTHHVTLTLEYADNLPPVRTDFQKFQQIVVNLLSNARYAVERRAVDEAGFDKQIFVALRTADNGGHVILEIRDNGIGMGREEQQRCLEPFYTTKPPGEGTGLGLSITYGLIQEFGFTLDIVSRKNEGTTFTVTMPVERTEETETQSSGEKA